MTHTPLTKAERDHLTLLHTAARDPMSTARERATAQAQLSDQLVWTGRTDPMNGDLPRLLADLDAAEAERDEAVALIDAAKSDVRPESFLEHAQAILAKCIAPYSCEQMKAVGDALAGCYRKWELMSEVALKAREDADSMTKCKGCGGTVGDHLAPDQGGCPGSFEIGGVQMVPLAGRDNAVAQRDRAESELDAERKMRGEAEAAAKRAEDARDALKAKLAAAESAHSELFLSGQVAELRGKLAALVEAVSSAETILGNMAKETGRVFGRWEINHEPLRNDAQRMLPSFRAAIAAARGGAQ